MCVLYIGGVVLILVSHITVLPSTIALIIKSAFRPQAVFGGGTELLWLLRCKRELVEVFSRMKVDLEVLNCGSCSKDRFLCRTRTSFNDRDIY